MSVEAMRVNSPQALLRFLLWVVVVVTGAGAAPGTWRSPQPPAQRTPASA